MSNFKILFSDIGGVLLSNGWGHESRQTAAAHFKFDYQEMSILHDFIFNVYEIGKISIDEYLNIVVFNKPRDFTKEEFIDFMRSCSVELPGMLPWLIDWRKKHRDIKIISINNEPRELNSYRIKKFGLHKFFDAFISSCEVGMRKPDPGIFELALGIAQVKPEECFYMDDREMLAKSGAKTGMKAHHHTNFEETKKLIESSF